MQNQFKKIHLEQGLSNPVAGKPNLDSTLMGIKEQRVMLLLTRILLLWEWSGFRRLMSVSWKESKIFWNE
jgi:hypothetical protein